MSEQARIDRIVICDACKRQIVGPCADTQHLFGERVDLCQACLNDGWYICASCGEVHNRVTTRELLSHTAS